MRRRCFCVLLCTIGLAFLLQPARAQESSPYPDLPVAGQPTISLAMFQQVLTQAESEAQPEAAAIYQVLQSSAIDPAFWLAVFHRESNYGTASTWAGRTPDGTSTHNAGNIRCGDPPYPTCYQGFRDYPTWLAGAHDWARIIQEQYVVQRGLTTVRAIIERYAPPSENDTEAYIQAVLADMQAWASGTTTRPDAGSAPGYFSVERWVTAPADGLKYDVFRSLAIVLWEAHRGIFASVEALQSFREGILRGFQPILDLVGSSLQNVARTVLIVGLSLGMLLLIVRPFIEARFVSIRRGIVVLMFLPILLPSASQAFDLLESARSDLADTIYTLVFDRARVELNEPVPLGAAAMGEVVLYFGDENRRATIDIASAYLYAQRTDVISGTGDLPEAFERTYFGTVVTDWSELAAARRAEINDQARRGTIRMALGLAPSSMALFEKATDTIYTFGVGILGLALLFAIVFALFEAFGQVVQMLAHQVLHLIVASWILGAVQAILVAYLYSQAMAGNAGAVLGLGIGGAFVSFIFMVCAGWLILKALVTSASVAATGSNDSAPMAGRTAQTIGGVVVGGAIGGIAGAAAGGASALQRIDQAVEHHRPSMQGMGRSILSYRAARRYGGSRRFATAYALGGSARAQHVAALGVGTGSLDPDGDIAQGLYAGAILARGEPASFRGIMNMAKTRSARSIGRSVGARHRPPAGAADDPQEGGPQAPPAGPPPGGGPRPPGPHHPVNPVPIASMPRAASPSSAPRQPPTIIDVTPQLEAPSARPSLPGTPRQHIQVSSPSTSTGSDTHPPEPPVIVTPPVRARPARSPAQSHGARVYTLPAPLGQTPGQPGTSPSKRGARIYTAPTTTRADVKNNQPLGRAEDRRSTPQ